MYFFLLFVLSECEGGFKERKYSFRSQTLIHLISNYPMLMAGRVLAGTVKKLSTAFACFNHALYSVVLNFLPVGSFYFYNITWDYFLKMGCFFEIFQMSSGIFP